MMISQRSLAQVLFAFSCAILFSNLVQAGIIPAGSITASSADGAWKYYESPQFQAPGFDITYVPKASDFSLATFQGYVTSDTGRQTVTGGDTWLGDGFARFEIFTTYIQSAFDQTITLSVAGDDGHALFIDGAFKQGGGFGVSPVGTPLALKAGESHQITVAGYNGPANWVFVVGQPVSIPLPPNNPQFLSTIESINGISMNADDVFAAATPEPSTIILLGLGCMGLACRRLRRNKPATRPA